MHWPLFAYSMLRPSGRSRVSARQPRYFSLLRQRKVPKRKASPAVCDPPLRSGQPAVLGPGLRRRTRYAPAALRSNNCGEADDEAGVSFGTPASPGPARGRRSQKGGTAVSAMTKQDKAKASRKPRPGSRPRQRHAVAITSTRQLERRPAPSTQSAAAPAAPVAKDRCRRSAASPCAPGAAAARPGVPSPWRWANASAPRKE